MFRKATFDPKLKTILEEQNTHLLALEESVFSNNRNSEEAEVQT